MGEGRGASRALRAEEGGCFFGREQQSQDAGENWVSSQAPR